MRDLIATFAPASSLPLHRHSDAYAALVVEGGYQEFGADGRWRCEAGDLVVHPELNLHGDQFGNSGCRVIDVALPREVAQRFCVLRLADPDLAVRAAVRGDIEEALPELISSAPFVPPIALPASLATSQRLLSEAERTGFAEIATAVGRSREHLARSFARWFGMTPGAYRRELRLPRALTELTSGRASAEAGAGAGYADQPHMCRSFRRELGVTPGSLQARCITPVQ